MSYKFSIPDGWVEAELDEFCTKVADGTHDSPKRTESGKLLVTSKNIIGGILDLSTSYRISEDNFNEINRRSKVDLNDVLLSMIGTVGEVCLIEQEPDFAIKNVGLLKNEDYLRARWLYFYLTSPQAQAQIKERLRGTTQQYLPLGEIRKFPIILPQDRSVMQSIVEILGALHDKIRLNHKINQTLEQMAQAIFKSWFVDFEPVKTKITVLEAGGSAEDALLAAMQAISGKNEALLNQLQTEQPEQYAELRATAELFPSAMQESELGEIPEGWTVTNLESLSVTITKGTTPTKSDIDGADDLAEVPFIKVKDISNNGEILSEGLDLIPLSVHKGVLKRSILIKDDLLFSIAGTIGRVAIVTEELDGANTNQAVGIVRLKDKNTYLPLIWQILKSDRAQNDIASKVVQGVQANASLKNLRDIHVLLPNEYILKIVTSNLSSILQQIATKYRENRTLAKVREILLPELLSGELQLPEGEVQIQEAADAV